MTDHATRTRDDHDARREAQVGDVMTTPAISIRPTTDARQVTRTMAARHIRVAPVLTAEGCLVGVISVMDLARAAPQGDPEADDPAGCIHPAADRPGPRLLARDLMSQSVPTIDPGADLAEARALMDRGRMGWLAVVDGRRHLVGVLSHTDLDRLEGAIGR